jgi:hypothetical protein
VPAADTEAGDDGPDRSLRDHSLTLADIDRLLEVSADVDRPGSDAPIRVWRDDLTFVLEALIYARSILAADVALLRHARELSAAGETTATATATATGTDTGGSSLDNLPRVLAPASEESPDPSPPQSGEFIEPEIKADLFSRTDELLRAHDEMADVDLTSSFDVAGSLAVIEEDLEALTERRDDVEGRLQAIRAAVIRRYQEGTETVRDQPA